jgi:hypothetical protein
LWQSKQLNIWDRTFRRRHGTPVIPVSGENTDDDDGTDVTEDEDDQDDDVAEALAGTSAKGGA